MRGVRPMMPGALIGLLGLGALAIWARMIGYPLLRLALVAAAGTATAYAIVAAQAALS